jgi:ribonuclease BN (tRNA processing enzyme)
MKLTVIGCSGTMPDADGPASSYLVEADGYHLLVDCGNGASGPVQRYTGLTGLDAVVISHVHADHCLDLGVFAFARRYSPGVTTALPVYGPSGLEERLNEADTAPRFGLRDAYEFHDLAVGRLSLGPFEIDLALMNHPVETFGMRIMADGASVTYSADTGECPALVDLARDTDLLLCEAAFREDPANPEGLHLTGRQAAEHAAKASARSLVLTHIPPWIDKQVSLTDAAAAYDGPVELARAGAVYLL